MAVHVVEAPYFEEESRNLGATNENIKAARSLVQAALDGRSDLVDVKVIENTAEDARYRPWKRIRGKKSGIRVAIEVSKDETGDDVVLLHVAAPRSSWTYEDIKKLWEKYRSKA